VLRFLRQKINAAGAAAADRSLIDWTQNLVLFFRAMALFLLAKGLVHWSLLISSGDGAGAEIDMEYLSANIYFAVLDPVAGVGLWLTSSWGAVLWLLAAVSQIAICLGFPEVFGALWPLVVFEAVAIGLYVYLTWKVALVSGH